MNLPGIEQVALVQGNVQPRNPPGVSAAANEAVEILPAFEMHAFG
jgi:hypothetical protein